MGVRTIVRDYKGNVLAFLYSYKPFIIHTTLVKAYTTGKIVEFSRDLGIQNIIIEGDALGILYATHNESCCWSRYGQLIDYAKIKSACVSVY
jgi:hypothetical protein